MTSQNSVSVITIPGVLVTGLFLLSITTAAAMTQPMWAYAAARMGAGGQPEMLFRTYGCGHARMRPGICIAFISVLLLTGCAGNVQSSPPPPVVVTTASIPSGSIGNPGSGIAVLNAGTINRTSDTDLNGSLVYGQTSADSYTVSSNGRATNGSGNEVVYIVSPMKFVMIDVNPADAWPSIRVAEQ